MTLPWQRERLPAAIAGLRAYDPGHDLVAWRRRFPGLLAELGSNETAIGPSPAALDAARSALASVYRYPDPLGGDLKRALSRLHGVDSDRIVLGNGSHELLMQLAQAFVPRDGTIVHSQYGFAVFAIAAAAVGAHAVCVPALPEDHASAPFGHDLDAMAAACEADTRLLYLANPNNPTGTWFELPALQHLLATVPASTLVVVDEAYGEFQPDARSASAMNLLAAHPNLVVTRTFSKAYALAGLRVGYALGHPDAMAVLERLRESFNVNGIALAAAEAALADESHLQKVLAHNEWERERLARGLTAMGLRVWPSRTNFLLVGFSSSQRSAQIEGRLCERAVIVRPMVGYGLGQCLRISVGSTHENDRLLAALEESL